MQSSTEFKSMSNLFSFLTRRFRCLWYYPFLAFLIAVGIFVGSPQITQAIPWLDILRQGVQVIQLSTISDSQEVELGKQINQQSIDKEIKLYRNPQIERYVNQIGQRLVKCWLRSYCYG